MPPNYTRWRTHQVAALELIADSGALTVASLPPGAGKSGIYMGLALWKKLRVCVVTATRALQNQLAEDFAACGILDVRGQQNYDCLIAPMTVADAPCHAEVPCMYKAGGCTYFDNLRRAPGARIVVTNYSLWFARGHDLGKFDLVVFDEAHASVEELARHLGVTITRDEIRTFLPRAPEHDWQRWARYSSAILRSELKPLRKSRPDTTDASWKRLVAGDKLLVKLDTLGGADQGAFTLETKPRSWHWEAIWPGTRRGLLFRPQNTKYLMVSGTITRKHLSLLGFGQDEYDFHEFGSTFPPVRRPVYVVPAPKMSARSGQDDHERWLAQIDNIIRTRQKRKGIIHAGSFARAEYLLQRSAFSGQMVSNRNARELAATIAEFRSRPRAILVSPSVVAGVDFPFESCLWQIICKIPFPDPRAPVNLERAKLDRDYALFVTAQEIVQASGRAVRSEDDYCETFIVDGTWQAWYYPKAYSYFPAWWRSAVIRTEEIPLPPTISSIFPQGAPLRLEK